MSTYENAYKIGEDVRIGLNEYSTAKMQGTDTVGAYSNQKIMQKINEAVRELYGLIVRRLPNLFMAEASLVGSNSVFTLPWDFGRLILFRDENGAKVYPMHQEERRLNASTGKKRLYYRLGNTLVLDQTGIGNTYSLVYIKKPRNIHWGKASAGAALSLTLEAATAPKIADYFNGMTIEDITGDFVDTISDYSAARVATLATGTGSTNDYYGIVPEIPEWAHHLIAPRAVFLTSTQTPVGQKQPAGGEQSTWYDMVRETLVEFAAPSGDVDWEELFTAYEPKVPPGIGIISE